MKGFQESMPRYFSHEDEGKGIEAELEIVGEMFVLKSGSTIYPELAEASAGNTTIPRRRAEHQNKIQDGILQEDIEFKKPSGAAEFVTGRSTNGYTFWYDAKKRTLDEWRIQNTTPKQPDVVKPKQQPMATRPERPERRDRQQPVPAAYDIKGQLLSLYGSGCQGCGRVFSDPDYLEVDHDQPKSDRGSNGLNNMQLLCGPCNRRKSNVFTLPGLRAELKRRGKKRYITERGLMDFRGVAAET